MTQHTRPGRTAKRDRQLRVEERQGDGHVPSQTFNEETNEWEKN